MNSTTEVSALIERIKRGDEDAASEFVREYEPELRRFIRFRMTSPHVRRFVDSMDICQSVLARFFTAVCNEEVEVLDAQRLRAFLITMARNRIYDAVAWENAGKRDARLLDRRGDDALAAIQSPAASPSETLAANEIIFAVYSSLKERDRSLVQMRMNGEEWAAIAAKTGGTVDQVRKRVHRAIDKAAEELGLTCTGRDGREP